MVTDVVVASSGGEAEFGIEINDAFDGGIESKAGEKKHQCCPQGHMLTMHTTKGNHGTCDGCSRDLAHGTTVMDCAACDYFLCNHCDPRVGGMAGEVPPAEFRFRDPAAVKIEEQEKAKAKAKAKEEGRMDTEEGGEGKEFQEKDESRVAEKREEGAVRWEIYRTYAGLVGPTEVTVVILLAAAFNIQVRA